MISAPPLPPSPACEQQRLCQSSGTPLVQPCLLPNRFLREQASKAGCSACGGLDLFRRRVVVRGGDGDGVMRFQSRSPACRARRAGTISTIPLPPHLLSLSRYSPPFFVLCFSLEAPSVFASFAQRRLLCGPAFNPACRAYR